MAKILYINPVIRKDSKPKHVPYGIALLAAISINEGHLVQVYDHNAWRLSDEDIKLIIRSDKWDVIAIGGLSTQYKSIKKLFSIASIESPDAILLSGGGYLTSMPKDILAMIPEITVGIVGEAVITIKELLAAIDSGNINYSLIDGLIYRDGNLIKFSKQRKLLDDLDSLPYPAWDLFPLEEIYFPNSSIVMSEESMMSRRRLDINMSYGCSMYCKYCFHLGMAGDMTYVEENGAVTDVQFDTPSKKQRSIRYHSPRYIVNMVKYMVEKYNIDFIAFLDENLMTMNRYSGGTWLSEICDLWVDEGLKPVTLEDGTHTGVYWGGTSHAAQVDKEILKKMGYAGCTYLDYGWESFSKQILQSIGKGSTPELNIRSYYWTLEAGIRPIPNQMFGFPSEDFDSIRDNIEVWNYYDISVKPFFVTPYPGSEWFYLYKEKILEQYGDLDSYLSDLGDATDISATICENFNAVELYGLRELMMRRDIKRINQFEKSRNNYLLEENDPSKS